MQNTTKVVKQKKVTKKDKKPEPKTGSGLNESSAKQEACTNPMPKEAHMFAMNVTKEFKQYMRMELAKKTISVLVKAGAVVFVVVSLISFFKNNDVVSKDEGYKFNYCYQGLFKDQAQVDSLRQAVSEGISVAIPNQ